MWEYFDLNKRALKGRQQFMKVDLHGVTKKKSSLMGLELRNEKKPSEIQHEDLDGLSLSRQIFMYIGVFIGVLFSSLVDQFKQGGNVHISFTVGQIIVSSVIALVIIPVVYEKLNLNPHAPFVVQFAIFVQNGIFWQVVIKAISAAI